MKLINITLFILATITSAVGFASDKQVNVFDDPNTTNAYKASYTPPTQAEILDSWSVFDGSNLYPNVASASGDAAAWFLNSNGQIEQPRNSSYPTGFISSKRYYDYESDLKVKSTNSDDDGVGFLIALKKYSDGSFSYLIVFRTQKGFGDEGLTLKYKSKNGSASLWSSNAKTISVDGASGGWRGSYSRLNINKSGHIVTIKASNFNSNDLSATMTVDLNDFTEFSNSSSEPFYYGYASYSQASSTFYDISFYGVMEGVDPEVVVDSSSNKVWKYNKNNSRWEDKGAPKNFSLFSGVRDLIGLNSGDHYRLYSDKVWNYLKVAPSSTYTITCRGKDKESFHLSNSSSVSWNIPNGFEEVSRNDNAKTITVKTPSTVSQGNYDLKCTVGGDNYVKHLIFDPDFDVYSGHKNAGDEINLSAMNPKFTGASSYYLRLLNSAVGSPVLSSDQSKIIIPNVAYPDGDQTYNYRLSLTDDFGSKSKDGSITVNSLPVVETREDLRGIAGDRLNIVSTPHDTNSVISISWSNMNGDSGDLDIVNPNSPTPYIDIPQDAVPGGVYNLNVQATDNEGLLSKPKTIHISMNYPPIADFSADPILGPDVFNEGNRVFLDGTLSHDDPRDPASVRGIASFKWEVLNGVEMTFSNPNGNQTYVEVPLGDTSPYAYAKIQLTVTDLEGSQAKKILTFRINRTPVVEGFGFKQASYVINETIPESKSINPDIYLDSPDDFDLRDEGSNEHLTVHYELIYKSGFDGEYVLHYNPNNVDGPLKITTGDYSSSGYYDLKAKLYDQWGLFVEKTVPVKINSLPTADLSAPDLIHEMVENHADLSNVFDDGEVKRIRWRLESENVDIDQKDISIDFKTLTFKTKDIANRGKINIVASLVDDDSGVVEISKEIVVNSLPFISVTTALKANDSGLVFVEDPQEIILETGTGDFESNDPNQESGVFDSDGNVVDISWKLIEGNPADIQITPQRPYQSPNLPYDGYKELKVNLLASGQNYVFEITATDNDGGVTVKNVSVYVNAVPTMDVKGSAISLRYDAKGYLQMINPTDTDGQIKKYEWSQLDGPVVTFDNPDQPTTRFKTISKLSHNGKNFLFRATITDDLGTRFYKDVEVDASDVFEQCGDVREDQDNPPGGSCHRNSSTGEGIINNDTCSSQVNSLWIPASFDSSYERSMLSSLCVSRHQYECKKCIPKEADEEYVECTLLPYMMPPKKVAYKVQEDGSLAVTDEAPEDSNFGQPINEPDVLNPDSEWQNWANSKAEYESMYLDKNRYPATRCLDVSTHKFWLNNDPNSGLSFKDEAHSDPNADVHPLDNHPCWNWDLQYRCVKVAINTCSDWSDANSYTGNLNNAPPEWELRGVSDMTVDNYLYWLHSPTGPRPKNNLYGAPQDALMEAVFHFSSGDRWQIQCKNDVTGEINQKISDTFCEKNADGTPNLLRCIPGASQVLISLGGMPLDQNGEVVSDPNQGPYFKCLKQNVIPKNDCQLNAVESMKESLKVLSNAQLVGETIVSYSAIELLSLPQCAEDPNGSETVVNHINDDPMSFRGDWEDTNTDGVDDCWEWESKWLFYNGDKFQWCTLNCSDGTPGVQQELVGCGLIDPTAEPVPEWEQWGEGWSQCVEPIIKTICPADATKDITLNGAPASQADIDDLECSNPIGIQDQNKSGTVTHSEVAMSCKDPDAAVISCIPDPNCELVSVTPTGLENGIYKQQRQEYVCKKTRKTCEKLVEVSECSPPDDFLSVDEEKSSFAKAAAAAQMVDGSQNSVTYQDGELKIFSGADIKCTFLTSEAMALYDIISGTLTGVLSYVTGGTAGYIMAGVGASELLSSQEFITQMGRCCNRDPNIVGKKVSMASLITSAVNALIGGQEQSKVPVCTGQEIRLAYARSMDSYNGHIIKSIDNGFYSEGSAFIKKPFGELSTYKDMEINLGPLMKLTIMKGQKWCVFNNIIARIIQVGARAQLKQLAINSADANTNNAVKTHKQFSYMGASNADYGWKNIGNVNGTNIMVYQWSPECLTVSGEEKSQKRDLVCPVDPEQVWTAYCSASSCDESELKGANLNDPADDWNPRRGVTGNWDIEASFIGDNSNNALTQYVIKKGLCDSSTFICDWDFYAWPAGGAASTVAFDMSPVIFGDNDEDSESSEPNSPHWGPTFGTTKYSFRFLELPPGSDWPTEMKVQIKDLNPMNSDPSAEQVVTIPMNIDSVDGFDLPISGMKLYGGCNEDAGSCLYTVRVPVTITAIPDSDCRGLTPDELMLIDFTKINFDDYTESLTARVAETGIDPDVMKSLAKTAISSYTDDIQSGKQIENAPHVDVGTFKQLNFSGPQIDILTFTQDLPFNMGFVGEIDIDWGDGSDPDLNIRSDSLLKLHEKRYIDAKAEHDSVCIPTVDNYITERKASLVANNDAWNEFANCVSSSSPLGTVYTVEDLTNDQISHCTQYYDDFMAKHEALHNYSCGDLRDKWIDLQVCVNKSSEVPLVFESDLNNVDLSSCSNEYQAWVSASNNTDSVSSILGGDFSSCGETARTETETYSSCAGFYGAKRKRYLDYKSYFEDKMNHGVTSIEYEHIWPTYNGDGHKDYEVTVTAKVFAETGNPESGVIATHTLKGLVRNWNVAIGKDTDGVHNIQASKPTPTRKAGDETIDSDFETGDAPNPNPDGSLEELKE